MNNYVFVGKIVNSFGIKGEVKIISDFEYKNKIFKKDFNLYIGEEKNCEKVNSYRVHKHFDLITFVGYSNINEILQYKGMNVYVNRGELVLNDDEYLYSDLIGLEVYDGDVLLGVVIDYEIGINNVLLKVKGEKTFYLPNIEVYIKEFDLKNRKILTNNGKNLII